MIGAHRRTTELGLIVLAVIVVGAAYTLASLGKEASIPANVFPFLGIIFGLLIGAHIAVRKLAPLADGILLPLAALLNGLGYVWIARLDKDLAALQATWTALGILGFVLTLLFVRRMRDLDTPYTLMVVGVGLLLLPLVPGVGRTINGAKIWVAIGPISFQPGEFAKIALAISFAAYLVRKREVLSMATSRSGPSPFPSPAISAR